MKQLGYVLFFVAGLLAQPVRAGIVLPAADGVDLHLETPAVRVITLSPNLAELLFAAGAGTRLVATVEYSDYPAEAARLPRVGDAFRLDIEGILALKPDLVIAWHSGTPGAAVEQLRLLGVPVWPVEIREPEEIALTLENIGRATDSAKTAKKAAGAFRARLQRLEQSHQNVEPLDYFYQVDARPLFTINGEHLISRGLALCGGRNIFSDEPALAFQVSHEAVIAADPDVLFAPSLPENADPLLAWREWTTLKSVRHNRLFLLNADHVSRATPRWLDSIETACSLLQSVRRTH
ncbi:MAG: cobalamin-binding protein [Lysobacterales bacterium]